MANSPEVTRRGLVAGAAALAAAAVVPMVPALAASPDVAMHAAWKRWIDARDAIEALDIDNLTNDEVYAAEAPFWAICDDAEELILKAKPETAAAAALKVKAALASLALDKEPNDALRRGDLDWLEGADLDWSLRLLVSAVRSLEAVGV